MQQPPEPPDHPGQLGLKILQAAEEARRCLDDLDSVPWPEMNLTYYMGATWSLDVVLRQLLDAIDAAVGADDATHDEATLSDSEKDFITTAGIPPETFGDAAHRRAQAWLAWSAIRLEQERSELNSLAQLTALDIVPGLRDVVVAFPAGYLDLDKLTVLQTPMEELGGMTPVRWLLTGGEPETLIALVRQLEFGS